MPDVGRSWSVMLLPRWAWSWGRATLYVRDGSERRYVNLGPLSLRMPR